MKSNRVRLGLVLVLAFSALVRLVPAIYTRMPFSNDVWPLIDITKTALLDGRIPSEDQGGHHVNWPTSIILAVLYSILTGFDLVVFYQYIGVFLVSISITLLCYVMVIRFTGDKVVSVLATLGLTILPSYTLYTSAYLKESFAYCVLLLCIYLLVQTNNRLHLTLVLAVYTSMVVSHPLASLMFIAQIVTHSYMLIVRCAKWRVCGEQLVVKHLFIVCIVATALYVFYNFVHVELPVTVELQDVLVFLTYSVFVYLSQVLLPTKSLPFFTTLFSVVLGIHLLRMVSVPLNELVFAFVIPIVIILITIIRNARTSNHVERGLCILRSYTLPVTAMTLYIITYAPHFLGILHRLLNYLVYAFPFSIASLAMNRRRFAVVLVTMFSVLTLLCSTACTLGLIPYLYYWRYTSEDMVLVNFLDFLNTWTIVEGDPKYSYMTKAVKPVMIKTLADTCNSRTLLVIPVEALSYGFPITPVDYVKLNHDVYTCGDLVYTSKRVFLVGFD